MKSTDPALITGWIAMAKSKEGSLEHEKPFWAFETVYRQRHDPDWAWEFILAVLSADQSNPVEEVLSAGPLEDLLADHGPAVIARVEDEARSNPQFARLLGGVWQNSMTDDVWQRVQAVRDRRGWDGVPE